MLHVFCTDPGRRRGIGYDVQNKVAHILIAELMHIHEEKMGDVIH